MASQLPINKGQTQSTVTPAMLLAGVENQARKTSYDTAAGLSAKFVERLIEAGQLRNMKTAHEAFQEGITLLQPTLQKELIAMSMKEIESYLPTEVVKP